MYFMSAPSDIVVDSLTAFNILNFMSISSAVMLGLVHFQQLLFTIAKTESNSLVKILSVAKSCRNVIVFSKILTDITFGKIDRNFPKPLLIVVHLIY